MVEANMRKFFVLLILILLSGCAARQEIAPSAEKNMALTSKKVLMVVAPVGFRDEEYAEPRQVLESAGAEIKVASIQSGAAKGAGGMEAKIDLTVSRVNVNDFDAVVFVGGPGMAEIIGDDTLQTLAKKFYEAGKLTTAICVAPAVLAKAGVLAGKKATAWSGAESDLRAGRADYTGERVTIDGLIITANGPAAAKEFGEKITEALR